MLSDLVVVPESDALVLKNEYTLKMNILEGGFWMVELFVDFFFFTFGSLADASLVSVKDLNNINKHFVPREAFFFYILILL